MQISKVSVQRFRCLKDSEVTLNQLTSIVGENNAGKSAFLRAIDAFFGSASSLSVDDYFKHDISEPITISLTFSNLTPRDKVEFAEHLLGDQVTITREFAFGDGKAVGNFYSEALTYDPFSPIRSAPNETDKKKAYHQLADEMDSPLLPKVTKGADVEPNLQAWENANTGLLTLHRKGRAFGFGNVALGKLRAAVGFHFIPAVQDASEQIDSDRSSPVRQLVADIVRQTIENQKDFQTFKEEAAARLKVLTDPANIPELATVSAELTTIVSKYYEESKIHARIEPLSDLPITFPKPRILVEDNNFISIIEKLGNGLQRAVLMSVLEFLALRATSVTPGEGEFGEAQSDILIAIEEPEIFQHPVKQRLFAQALSKLATGFNKSTGIRFQVLLVTHSHLFIDIKEAQNLRLVRRQVIDGHAVPRVSTVSIEECAEATAIIQGYKLNVEKYRLGLHIFNPHVSEGVFSKAVVLVEGVSDKVILDAYFIQRDFDPLLKSVTVAAVGGKTNMDKPLSILDRLEIPVFALVDNDKDETRKIKNNIKINRLIQMLCGVKENACEEYPSGLNERAHFFQGNLEKYIRSRAGPVLYDKMLAELADTFDSPASDCSKSPHFMSMLFALMIDANVEFPELEAILAWVRSVVEKEAPPIKEAIN